MLQMTICLSFLILGGIQCQQQQQPWTIHRPGVDDQCAKFCDEKFAAAANSSDTCKQGCRLFSLIQLTNNNNVGLMNDLSSSERAFHDECSKSCRESYTQDRELTSACVEGCQNQTIQTGSIQVEMDSRSPLFSKVADFSSQMFQPMMNMFDNWGSSMHRMMHHDNGLLGSASERDDDLSLDFSRDPVISQMFDRMRSMMNFDNFFGQSNRPKTLAPEIPAAQNQVGNKDDDGEPILSIHMIPLTQIDPIPQDADDSSTLNAIKNLDIAREPSPPVVEFTDDDWMTCVGRRIRHLSILTKWTMCLAMMLSLIGMMWLCLAVLFKPKKQRHLHYILPSAKGGVDNVYYTTPPYNAGDKAPMIVKTGGEYAENKTPLNDFMPPPPAYEAAVAAQNAAEEQKN